MRRHPRRNVPEDVTQEREDRAEEMIARFRRQSDEGRRAAPRRRMPTDGEAPSPPDPRATTERAADMGKPRAVKRPSAARK